MLTVLICTILLLPVISSYPQYGTVNVDKYIQDAEVFEEGQLPHRNLLIPFGSVEAAVTKHYSESVYYHSLNGKWKFHLENTPYTFPKDFYTTAFNDTAWNDIAVPGVWQMQGYDHMIYRNIPMEFHPYDPPYVPKEINPTGAYRRSFTVPENWNGRKIILHFDGVMSAAFVWVNGKYLGYNEDSFVSAEFDVTDYVIRGDNQITVLVPRWCSGSYLEDADMWRFSGIFRDVYIYSKPAASLNDLFVITDFDESYKNADLIINVTADPELNKNSKLKFTLLDADGKEVTAGVQELSFNNGKSEIKKKYNKPAPLV